MQFSEQWLRHYVNPQLSSDELADALTMAGLEVEDIDPVAPPFTGIVVAAVLTKEKHPNADKLSVCTVDAGTGTILQIVCGAPNVEAGVRVPCALDGAVLPGDFRIKPTKMRGVESQGMLCSARELGLSEDHGGLLLLPADAPVGANIRDYLELDDRKFTIKLTPNRGDALSLIGVARDLHAITGAEFKQPSFAPLAVTLDERLPVKVEAADLCGRFSGRIIRGLNAHAATPAWMVQRLERSGQRSISALVDISNYVMLELGRPSHVFDLAKVAGGLTVRWGQAGESVELLNGQTVRVDKQVGVIADDRGVEGLAGIMGGAATAVSLETTAVFVEAAFWWPEAIQGRGRRFNFSTDAAHRFERGVDAATTVEHIEYISRLIVEICGTDQTRVGPVDDQILALPARKPVKMRIERARKVIGVAIAADEMAEVFTRLGFDFERSDEAFLVTPPSYRFDIEIEEDLIEEVARLVGYERLPEMPPLARAAMRAQPEAQRTAHDLRRSMAALGYQELINFSFVEASWERDFAGNETPIPVLNPIASQLAVMRSQLMGGLTDILKYNLNRKTTRARLFEVGRVFSRAAEAAAGPLAVAGIAQPMHIAGLAYGPAADEQWGVGAREVDFYDVKGEVERLLAPRVARFEPAEHPALHPGRSAAVVLDGRRIGFVGELHPRLQQAYELPRAPVMFELEVEPLLAIGLPSYREVSKFQALARDISVSVADEVPVQSLIEAVVNFATSDARLACLREFRLFDVYRPREDSSKLAGEDAKVLLHKEKSLAFRVALQDASRPLSDANADAAMSAIVEALAARGARLRQ
ncbi:MAG: phenylalanine--tRNA ligase subunit beta [Burkholderiaceae bacterium]